MKIFYTIVGVLLINLIFHSSIKAQTLCNLDCRSSFTRQYPIGANADTLYSGATGTIHRVHVSEDRATPSLNQRSCRVFADTRLPNGQFRAFPASGECNNGVTTWNIRP